jgi:four helix bundle protein
MTYERFEELPVWQEAVRLVESIYTITQQPAFKSPASFRSQLERAALSVSNNIAEGFERGTTQELLTFIYIARGSAGEVRSMLHLLQRHPAWLGAKPIPNAIPAAHQLAESCSRQLRAWADTLQNTEIKGQRYLTRQAIAQANQARRAEAFRKKPSICFPTTTPSASPTAKRTSPTSEPCSQSQISNLKFQILPSITLDPPPPRPRNKRAAFRFSRFKPAVKPD